MSKKIVVEPKKLYVKKEPIRFKLKKVRLIGLDDKLRDIYEVEN